MGGVRKIECEVNKTWVEVWRVGIYSGQLITENQSCCSSNIVVAIDTSLQNLMPGNLDFHLLVYYLIQATLRSRSNTPRIDPVPLFTPISHSVYFPTLPIPQIPQPLRLLSSLPISRRALAVNFASIVRIILDQPVFIQRESTQIPRLLVSIHHLVG